MRSCLKFIVRAADAVINSGNSDGAAFNDKGSCVGIAFQSLKHEGVENIGYVIPTRPHLSSCTLFRILRRTYTGTSGFLLLGVEWQKMKNPDLSIAMGMKSNKKDVRVWHIDRTGPESKVLQPSDVILSFDGVDITNDGTVWKGVRV